MNRRLIISLLCLLLGGASCRKDTSARDKFLGIYSGDRICTNSTLGIYDTIPSTISIDVVPEYEDSLDVHWLGIDSAWATQRASFGGNILDFVNNNFAGELNGDTLIINDYVLGYSCKIIAVRQ